MFCAMNFQFIMWLYWARMLHVLHLYLQRTFLFWCVHTLHALHLHHAQYLLYLTCTSTIFVTAIWNCNVTPNFFFIFLLLQVSSCGSWVGSWSVVFLFSSPRLFSVLGTHCQPSEPIPVLVQIPKWAASSVALLFQTLLPCSRLVHNMVFLLLILILSCTWPFLFLRVLCACCSVKCFSL